ncbi:hypothetical protein CYMTET_29643 [Cymbomonas tetramitiformis]|uniref:Uncharacterized protein n=1 Tax=Cymbomonas tetramitiformis TaxID=36881 RepID=A0AAE0FKU9_9CHLO|nr:hypothetical protein CYMTET_29643 [Cymbomonas tetramitiformis]
MIVPQPATVADIVVPQPAALGYGGPTASSDGGYVGPTGGGYGGPTASSDGGYNRPAVSNDSGYGRSTAINDGGYGRSAGNADTTTRYSSNMGTGNDRSIPSTDLRQSHLAASTQRGPQLATNAEVGNIYDFSKLTQNLPSGNSMPASSRPTRDVHHETSSQPAAGIQDNFDPRGVNTRYGRSTVMQELPDAFRLTSAIRADLPSLSHVDFDAFREKELEDQILKSFDKLWRPNEGLALDAVLELSAQVRRPELRRRINGLLQSHCAPICWLESLVTCLDLHTAYGAIELIHGLMAPGEADGMAGAPYFLFLNRLVMENLQPLHVMMAMVSTLSCIAKAPTTPGVMRSGQPDLERARVHATAILKALLTAPEELLREVHPSVTTSLLMAYFDMLESENGHCLDEATDIAQKFLDQETPYMIQRICNLIESDTTGPNLFAAFLMTLLQVLKRNPPGQAGALMSRVKSLWSLLLRLVQIPAVRAFTMTRMETDKMYLLLDFLTDSLMSPLTADVAFLCWFHLLISNDRTLDQGLVSASSIWQLHPHPGDLIMKMFQSLDEVVSTLDGTRRGAGISRQDIQVLEEVMSQELIDEVGRALLGAMFDKDHSIPFNSLRRWVCLPEPQCQARESNCARTVATTLLHLVHRYHSRAEAKRSQGAESNDSVVYFALDISLQAMWSIVMLDPKTLLQRLEDPTCQGFEHLIRALAALVSGAHVQFATSAARILDALLACQSQKLQYFLCEHLHEELLVLSAAANLSNDRVPGWTAGRPTEPVWLTGPPLPKGGSTPPALTHLATLEKKAHRIHWHDGGLTSVGEPRGARRVSNGVPAPNTPSLAHRLPCDLALPMVCVVAMSTSHRTGTYLVGVPGSLQALRMPRNAWVKGVDNCLACLHA